MPLISNIGRKAASVRALHAGIYALLVSGSLAIVYPIGVMVAGSTKSAVDAKTFDLVPAYLRDDVALYRKHVEGLFNERLADLQVCYGIDAPSFEAVDPPASPNARYVEAWREFLRGTELPPESWGLGYVQAQISRTMPHHLRRYKDELLDRYGGNIARLNAALGAEFGSWSEVYLRAEDFLPRRGKRTGTPWDLSYYDYKLRQGAEDRYYFSADGFYRTLFLKSQYTRDIAAYNAEHGTSYSSYDDIRLARSLPGGTEREREDWEIFVRQTLNLLWIRVDESETGAYRDFLRAKYGDIATLNRAAGTTLASFDGIALPDGPPSGVALSDWDAFISGWKDPDTGVVHQPAASSLRLRTVEFLFQDHLRARFGDVAAMNAELGTAFAAFEDALPPQRDAHHLDFLERRGWLKGEFTTRNFKTVGDYILLHGRGALNTTIYCILAILTALLVNPLAAYALSRYRMPSAYKILLFLLLTMAFPPMVTQIPVFLMLRDLNLLNTFAALVLPVMANGYSIFLLKGFFDALPRELYESASMDGAGEWTMFWNITMSLSRPILAVIALGAFHAAYAAFMFALLICQDERMWTLMVWLYQLQSRSGPGVVYASLLMAAVPTLVVFLFCQNIILRGIVLPSEK